MLVSEMVYKMEEGTLHPSVFYKIQGQSYLFVSNSQKSQASSTVQCGAITYVKGMLNSLHPSHQGTASPPVPPMLPIFVGAPSEKRKDEFFAVTGIIAMMASAPAERMKLMMQCQNEIVKTGRLSHPYKGIGDCFTRIIRNEGSTALWRGISASMIDFLSQKILKIGCDNWLRSTSMNHKKDHKVDYWNRIAMNTASLFLAGGGSLFLFYPLIYAHTRLATDIGRASERQFKGLVDVWRKTLRTDGTIGLYRGCGMAFVHSMSSDIVFQGMRHALRPQLLGLLGLLRGSSGDTVVLCGIQILSQLVIYPMETVYLRMMMRSGEAVKYRSSLDAFSQIVRSEGVGSLYKGATAYVLKRAILFGVLFGFVSLLTRNAPSKKAKSREDSDHSASSILSIKWKSDRDNGQGS